jgi:hypothetical protein
MAANTPGSLAAETLLHLDARLRMHTHPLRNVFMCAQRVHTKVSFTTALTAHLTARLFELHGANVVPASQFHASAILLSVITRYEKQSPWIPLQCHCFHTDCRT